MQDIPLYGFTLLRNGVKYDYCFLESLRSLAGVTKSIYLALGDNQDDTEKKISEISSLKIIPTIWDESLRAGGLILSEQTNIALNAIRSEIKTPNAWGFYLQCDEVLHQADYALIKQDLQKAQAQNCDAISFRYLHFWKSHHNIAINKKWYPQEIRAIKINTSIESWGDAQSFRNYSKIYYSEARIFHYGHVREVSKYKNKKEDILKLYHTDQKLSKYQKREKKFDDETEILKYWGSHPSVMQKRIESMGEVFSLPTQEHIFIVGNEKKYSDEIKKNILAKKITWVSSLSQVPKTHKDKMVILSLNLWQKIFYPSVVPLKMRSKLAHPWSFDFYLTLKLSEKDIGVL
ncbi:MAG: hypothetical protein KBD63_01195 [Bacteriovoracaceae bacterium]|nr:hypothetical protein [Bacteriovoracaceae bacterium]